MSGGLIFTHGQKWETAMNRVARIFTDHPASVDETYFEHMAFAGKFSGKLFLAAFAALIHALLPFLFESTASGIIRQLYERTHNRAKNA